MKLTKYQHACFSVEVDGQSILVDPGNLTADFAIPDNLLAIVITHQHDDHCDIDKIKQIIEKLPDIQIFCPSDTIQKLNLKQAVVINSGDIKHIGPFKLEFGGHDHALIHQSIPRIQNTSLMVNDLVYYSGDSFALPPQPVDVLLIPASAPWMQISQAIDFLTEIKPRLAIPTHDAIYSPAGKTIADKLLSNAANNIGCQYKRLDTALEI